MFTRYIRYNRVRFTPSSPLMWFGKFMRMIPRKIASVETESLGDTSTLADPSEGVLIEKVGEVPDVGVQCFDVC